jgi:hypothetical protein
MNPNDPLIVKLEQKIVRWDALAHQARIRADQQRPGDLNPAYLDGCADQLEQNAQALRDVIREVRSARGDQRL